MVNTITFRSTTDKSRQETLVRQHQAVNDAQNISAPDALHRQVRDSLAALRISTDAIKWLLTVPFENAGTDLLFVGALLILTHGDYQMLAKLLSDPAPLVYEDLLTSAMRHTYLRQNESNDTVDDRVGQLMDELSTVRAEYQHVLREVKEALKQSQAKGVINEHTDNDVRTAYEMMRRVIGSAHLTDASPTYETLFNHNTDLEEQIAYTQKQLQDAVDRSQSKNIDIARYRKEILHIRRLYQKQKKAVLEMQRNQNRGFLSRFLPSENHSNDSVIPEIERSETLDEFIPALMRDQRFMDDQVLVLSTIIKDGYLSLQEIKEIANPELSERRMWLMKQLYYEQHGIHADRGKPATTKEESVSVAPHPAVAPVIRHTAPSLKSTKTRKPLLLIDENTSDASGNEGRLRAGGDLLSRKGR